ncbi:MAG TPA: tRNA (adenosine(37)-N6)-threonylcarbamoyltransferase complex dimerization subunit type 1 TsaB [Bacilli bacterium]|nr:tRNA (adenosine(37)-N6)-threonylcarbamoyltransferase complex dimerization subunit type 1 TsaB [Bacilli bacterium]
MPYVALDTATQSLTIAVGERGMLLGEASTYVSKNHSVKLMPLLESLLASLDVTPDQLQGIIVGRGPGSYTGVRIAVTAAKALAFALGIPLLGVSSLDAIAYQGQVGDALVVPMIDARRKQAYTAFYETQNGLFVKLTEDRLETVDSIVKQVQSRMVVRRLDKSKPAQVLFLGDGAQNHREELVERLGEKARFASFGQDVTRAAFLLEVGIPRIEAGESDDPHTLEPEYLQLHEAEQKWLAQQRQAQATESAQASPGSEG